MPLWQELPLLLLVAFCLAVLIRTFLVQAFFIPSGSMEDTLLIGDRVLVNKVVYDMRDPLHGEVIVFKGTDSWAPEITEPPDPSLSARLSRAIGDLVGVSRPGERDFIKRVIGLPGDRVSCCDDRGRIVVNGRGIDEPYVLENSDLNVPPNPSECRSRRFEEIVVKPGNMFVMGDHRSVSLDSRCQGQVPIRNIIGRAFVIVWPSSRFTGLSVPPIWQGFAASSGAEPAAGESGPSGPDPIGGVFIMPMLASSLISARSGPLFRAPRRRLPS